MFTRKSVSIAMLAALAYSSTASAIETFAYIKNETSVFVTDGRPTGSARSMLDTDDSRSAGEGLKFENSGRLFLNGDIGEDSSWHGDLSLIYDGKAIDDGGVEYEGYRIYSQHDWLRELYLDTYLGDWYFRLGKQQVVWGTADGIKLLDIINPTDWRELNQNAFEDSRVPIWMAKAERNIGENNNIQLIVSQVEENKIPGLNGNGDSGHSFIAKGVDSITGDVNGFLNVAPALAKVATSFSTGASLGLIGGAPSPLGLVPVTGLSVEGFAGAPKQLVDVDGNPATSMDRFIALPDPATGTFGPTPPGSLVLATSPGYVFLNDIAQNGLAAGDPNGNDNVTNLMPVTGPTSAEVEWNPADATSAFEYMANASFATFNTFDGASTRYVRDYPDDEKVNAGFRFKRYLDNGLNFSVNYFYHYGANPEVNLSWHDAVTGDELTVQRAPAGDLINNGTGAPGADGMPDLADFGTSLGAGDVPGDIGPASGNFPTTILLHNEMGQYYGRFDPTGGFGTHNTNPVELRFTEELYRVHSLGGAFDYALDTDFAPIVIRGEFLYDRDEKQPVVDKRLLAIGDLSNALVMEETDMFKYVIGVDVTVMTNLLVSGQFIQFRNLDFEERDRTCTTQTGVRFDCSKYTADFATLHLTNGMQKGWKNKEFYSLFFSKPFGPSDEHRWNNITIREEGGGWWNRLDVEYQFSDELIASAEWNQYWGDEDTQFGQFEDSSNLQVGLKYIFE